MQRHALCVGEKSLELQCVGEEEEREGKIGE